MPATLNDILQTKGAWGLALAYAAAAIVLKNPVHASPLIAALFSQDARVRRHAADVGRRVTERDPALLRPFAERILGALALAQDRNDDWRMLAHMGLVAARVTETRAHRQRAAGLLHPLLHHPGNVVRCTALEGLGLLASRVPELRMEVQPILDEALLCGTRGMQCRARVALARLG